MHKHVYTVLIPAHWNTTPEKPGYFSSTRLPERTYHVKARNEESAHFRAAITYLRELNPAFALLAKPEPVTLSIGPALQEAA